MIKYNQKEEKPMLSALLKFNTIPQIGFAHHFYTDNYHSSYKSQAKSFEIVYVNSGSIEAELYGKTFTAEEGSVFVLFRHLPISLKSSGNKPHSHCTVQVEFDYNFRLISDDTKPQTGSLILPFVTPPCPENEFIKKELYKIVSDLGISREENSFSSSLRFLEIMRRIDEKARKTMTKNDSSSVIDYKIKKYVTKNIEKNISLSEIADYLSLTPGYINHVFKETAGMPIKQYINNEKAKKIAVLMQKQGLSFKIACENVGITDYSYGYRLFKKHTGTTPSKFLSGDVHI